MHLFEEHHVIKRLTGVAIDLSDKYEQFFSATKPKDDKLFFESNDGRILWIHRSNEEVHAVHTGWLARSLLTGHTDSSTVCNLNTLECFQVALDNLYHKYLEHHGYKRVSKSESDDMLGKAGQAEGRIGEIKRGFDHHFCEGVKSLAKNKGFVKEFLDLIHKHMN